MIPFFSYPMQDSNLHTKEWCPNLNRVCLPIPPMGHIAEILGLEPRHSDSKSEMLPLHHISMADAAGFEPATPGFGDQCSNRAELRT